MAEDVKLPEGWGKVRLGEVCVLSYGKNLPSSKFKEDGKYKVFGANGVIGFYDKYTHKEQVVLISCRGEYSGKINISETYSYITNNSIPLVIKYENLLTTKFLYYALKNVPKNRFVSGSAQPQVLINDLENIEVIIPESLPEQRKIAEILETVDNAIGKTEKIIEKYKRIKQGLMQELLTKGIDENGQIRSEETHKFKDSPLGRIPEEWEVVELGKVVEIEGGYAFKSDRFLMNGEYQVIKMGNLYNAKLNLEKEAAYLNTLNKQEKKDLLEHLDILITLTGTVGKKDYGYTIILKHPKKLVFNQRVARIRVLDKQNNAVFIFYITKMEFFLNQFFDSAKGGTGNQANVSVNDLKRIQIPLPPLPEQKHIASILSQIDEAIEKEQKYKEKLERIKRGLMEDLLSGKVRVNRLLEK